MTHPSDLNEGIQKVAAVVMSLPEEQALKIFSLLKDEEIIRIARAISELGIVKERTIDRLLGDFLELYENYPVVSGGVNQTNQFLSKLFPKKKVDEILKEVTTPPLQTCWEKLNHLQPTRIAKHLEQENPQIIAVILSKLSASVCAQILSHLPESIACEVIVRFIQLEPVHAEVLQQIETKLQNSVLEVESIEETPCNHKQMIHDIFHHFDVRVEKKLLQQIHELHPESASKIRSCVLNFEDITKLSLKDLQTVINAVDLSQLAQSLVGVSKSIRKLFIDSMNEGQKETFELLFESTQFLEKSFVRQAQQELMEQIYQLVAKKKIRDPFE
jgi:flagellar motor switch protein FliG